MSGESYLDMEIVCPSLEVAQMVVAKKDLFPDWLQPTEDGDIAEDLDTGDIVIELDQSSHDLGSFGSVIKELNKLAEGCDAMGCTLTGIHRFARLDDLMRSEWTKQGVQYAAYGWIMGCTVAELDHLEKCLEKFRKRGAQ